MKLKPRDLIIINKMIKGDTYSEIGKQIGIHRRTVIQSINRMKIINGIDTNYELVVMAAKEDVI